MLNKIQNNKYAIVIPTYNESENLPYIIEKIFKIYKNIRVLIVDDDALEHKRNHQIVLHYSKNSCSIFKK